MKIPTALTLTGLDFQLTAEPGRAPWLTLARDGAPLLTFGGLRCDDFEERNTLVTRFRKHLTDDRLAGSLVLENTIPFGGEYRLRRTLELVDRRALVTLDVTPGAGLRTLELEPLCAPGPWRELRIRLFDGTEYRRTPGAEPECYYAGATPILALQLRGEDGRELEIGVGGDLWRHAGAEADGLFEVSGQRDEIRCRRRPLALPETDDQHRRTRRFCSYFCWNWTAEPPPAPDRELPFATAELPPSAFRLAADARPLPEPCLTAAATRRRLRDLLRRESGPGLLALALPEPGVCHDAAHLERPGKKSLLHADLDDYFELHAWAGRQLARTGGALLLKLPGDRLAVRNLARPLRPLQED